MMGRQYCLLLVKLYGRCYRLVIDIGSPKLLGAKPQGIFPCQQTQYLDRYFNVGYYQLHTFKACPYRFSSLTLSRICLVTKDQYCSIVKAALLPTFQQNNSAGGVNVL
jgi:hypothetical protein